MSGRPSGEPVGAMSAGMHVGRDELFIGLMTHIHGEIRLKPGFLLHMAPGVADDPGSTDAVVDVPMDVPVHP